MGNIDKYGNIIEKDNNYVKKRGNSKIKYVLFFLIWLIVLGLYLFSNKQILTQNKVITWDKIFGGDSWDVFNSLISISDGGYIVAGYTQSKGAAYENGWILSLDPLGNKIQEKIYGGEDNCQIKALIKTTDGGYALAGQIFSNYDQFLDVWIFKLDKNYNIIWNKTFGGSDNDRAYSLIQTTDGGYAVAGEKYSQMNNKGFDAWIIKLDSQGRMEWDITYGGKKSDRAYSLIQTTDSGYAIIGETESQDTLYSDAWILKLNSQGKKLWERIFSKSNRNHFYSLLQANNNDYLVAGNAFSDAWILRLDSQGILLWQKNYGGNSYNDIANSLIRTADGNYALAGFTVLENRDAWIFKFDSQGNKLWEKTFSGDDLGEFNVIISASDGGYVAAGWIASENLDNLDAWILKLDGRGNLR